MEVKWIPIENVEDLPEQGEEVLVCGWAFAVAGERPKQISIGFVNKEYEPDEPVVSEEIEEIRYWMPMPEMPEF